MLNKDIEVYICSEIIEEYIYVVNRPKIQKYITKTRIKETLEIIERSVKNVKRKGSVKISRDVDDDYLLALSVDYNITYLVTGDKDLLVLEKFEKTTIVNVATFLTLLNSHT